MDLEESSTDNYEVFLSFRGLDTRHMFTDVLYHTMVNAGIRVFRDDDELDIGDKIDKILLAVNNSQICVPIFSKTFAQSKWCLMEVRKMVELNKVVVPIFYDVTPDDVKLKRSEAYTGFMAEHENAYGKEKRQVWEDALKSITKFKGRKVDLNKGLPKFCVDFVEEILNKLRPTKRYNIDPLVGIEDQLESAIKLLDIKSDGILCISIHGMRGIGKTTLAKTIFNKLSGIFEYSSFVENIISECSAGLDGIENLRRKLNSSYHARDISERFCKKKVLLILDDVDKKEQIKELIGEPSWLGSGSRIIITTRNNDVLTKYATLYEGLDVHSFEMAFLEYDQSLQLFNRYAFGKTSPPSEFCVLSKEAISFARGLPLALIVISSSLCTCSVEVWKDVIARLKDIPPEEVKKKLKISYDALERDHQQIFLDIACFFIGIGKSNPWYMWKSCKLHPTYGLAVLESRCLIKITEDNEVWMHDQLRDLGHDIVREESTQNIAKRSRLWADEDALEVLMGTEGKEMVQALSMHKPLVNTLTDEHFGSFQDIRFLELAGGNFKGKSKDLLGNLRWLSWRFTPRKFNLSNFYLEKLVILDLFHSSIDENWGGWSKIQMANNLKVLDLRSCHRLTRTPEFKENHSLERLIFSKCRRLATIGSSIKYLRSLNFLDISNCDSLSAFSEEMCSLTDLQEILSSRSGVSLTTFTSSMPESIVDINSWISHILIAPFGLKTMPDSLGDLKSLGVLDLSNCWGLSELPDSIGGLGKLKELSLGQCYRLDELPSSLWHLTSLVRLDLSWTNVNNLPASAGGLQELKVLDISHCMRIRELPASIGMLKKLVELDAANCLCLEEIPSEIGQLFVLRRLDFSGTSIRTLPSTFCQLSLLQELNLGKCDNLQELPELSRSLTELSAPVSCMKEVHDQSRTDTMSSITINTVHDLEAIESYLQS